MLGLITQTGNWVDIAYRSSKGSGESASFVSSKGLENHAPQASLTRAFTASIHTIEI